MITMAAAQAEIMAACFDGAAIQEVDLAAKNTFESPSTCFLLLPHGNSGAETKQNIKCRLIEGSAVNSLL
jgi:hypothetical protein